MELLTGRPEDLSGRLEREIRTSDIIDKFLPAIKHEYRTVHLTSE